MSKIKSGQRGLETMPAKECRPLKDVSTSHWPTFFIWVPLLGSLVAEMVNCLPAMQGTRVQSLAQEDPLEKEVAIHSSTLTWKIPWTEEPGRLQFHWIAKSWTRLSNFTFSPLLG